MEKAAVGIGSNLGDSAGTCKAAFEVLRKQPAINILQTSSLYRTKPVGFVDQDWFINAAALCETALEPEELLEVLLMVEKDFGRVRTTKWGPRTLDLDILHYGDMRVDTPRLHIPHPLLHERMFALAPLAEIDPGWLHPVMGLSAAKMLDRLRDSDGSQEIEKLDI